MIKGERRRTRRRRRRRRRSLRDKQLRSIEKLVLSSWREREREKK
jgi:hypothetical protein